MVHIVNKASGPVLLQQVADPPVAGGPPDPADTFCRRRTSAPERPPGQPA